MAKTRNPRYLQQRYRRWYATIDIPKKVRRHFDGRARFVKSLETDSLTIAEQRVGPVVAHWKQLIELARSAKNNPEAENQLLSEEWREEYLSSTGKARKELDSIFDDALDGVKFPNEEAEKRFVAFVTGKTIRTNEKLDAWISTLTGQKQKTLDMKRSDVARFAKRFPYSSDVTRKGSRLWVDQLQQSEGLSAATVRRIISACKGYWEYLQTLQIVADEIDPFAGVSPTKKQATRNSAHTRRAPFTAAQAVRTWRAAYDKGDTQLGDLIWCAMWTGCRIEELCSLKLGDISDDRFQIRDGKTNAGWREIPIHPQLSDAFKRLNSQGGDNFLLSDVNRHAKLTHLGGL
ncbi:DUF6538 domain-containing protein [Primorskyibacter flagellatus]|uniref:DUF6538 domain-containing protein n=1 Tax=Primorskyibacter flagellatus TaxID=1387277 RepID=UPI003A95C1E5